MNSDCARRERYLYISDIANSKLLLCSADFTESSYDYIASVWHCPVKPVEQEAKAKKESSLASRLLSSWLCKDRCEASQGVQPLVRSTATQRMTVRTGIQAPQDALRGNLVAPYRSAPFGTFGKEFTTLVPVSHELFTE